jgi:hypothetical protein
LELLPKKFYHLFNSLKSIVLEISMALLMIIAGDDKVRYHLKTITHQWSFIDLAISSMSSEEDENCLIEYAVSPLLRTVVWSPMQMDFNPAHLSE